MGEIALPSIFPPITPYETGYLSVGDGHRLYYERCGRAGGVPAVFLHGGPGAGCLVDHRRLFDPAVYDVLLFDQRGCGRSQPLGLLEANTTWHLVADIERLRELTGVERWLVFGGSWGATLALAYAQRHSDRVTALILRGVFTLRRSELDWLYRRGASEIYPDYWRDFVGAIAEPERHNVLTVYHKLLHAIDPAVRYRAAVAWWQWEARQTTLIPRPAAHVQLSDEAVLALARIENHYFVHHGWLAEGQLLDQAGKLADIPGTIVQGRHDTLCPPVTAFELATRWRKAKLIVAEGAGHSAFEPAILARLIEATAFHGQALAGADSRAGSAEADSCNPRRSSGAESMRQSSSRQIQFRPPA